MKKSLKGDDRLCGFELKLWQITYSVLCKFGHPVIFRWDRMNVPEGKDGIITWFIPSQAENYKKIKDYLMEEMANDIRLPTKETSVEGLIWPGTQVLSQSYRFSGLDLYVTRKEIEPMIKSVMESFMAKVKREKANDSEY